MRSRDRKGSLGPLCSIGGGLCSRPVAGGTGLYRYLSMGHQLPQTAQPGRPDRCPCRRHPQGVSAPRGNPGGGSRRLKTFIINNINNGEQHGHGNTSYRLGEGGHLLSGPKQVILSARFPISALWSPLILQYSCHAEEGCVHPPRLPPRWPMLPRLKVLLRPW